MAAGGHLRVARDLVRGCVAGLCKVLLCCCYGGGCGVRHGDRAWTAALLDHVRLSPCTTHQHQQHLTARGSARTSLRRGARYYGAGVAAASASTAPGPAHPPRVLAPRSAPAASASSLLSASRPDTRYRVRLGWQRSSVKGRLIKPRIPRHRPALTAAL